jgi:protein-S-isoprenylcysteine O-methyltransferase Ste14
MTDGAAGRAAPGVLPTTPPAWFFAAVIATLALDVLAPGPRWLRPPWTWLGVVPVALGAALHAWAAAEFRREATTSDPEGRPSTLVRGGPYARTRNPMYLAGAPILIGACVLLGSTTPILVLPLYLLGASRWIHREEARLRERFGGEWSAYADTVRRWI